MHALKYWRRVSKLIESYTDKITSRITFSITGTPRKKAMMFYYNVTPNTSWIYRT